MSIFINGWTKEKVIKHIEENFKGKSVGDHGFCAYKTLDGKKCAVGLFMPEGHAGMREIGDVMGLLENHDDLEDFLPFSDEKILIEFQESHDTKHLPSANESSKETTQYGYYTDDEVLNNILNFVYSLED